MTAARAEFECAGKVRLGTLSSETEARLGKLAGEWLEYSPEEHAVVVRHVQPDGTPAMAAVPSELIAIVDTLAPGERDAIPGGSVVLRDPSGVLLRLTVQAGDIRIQWPREDWSQAVPVEVDQALRAADPFHARISGSATFHGASGAETRLLERIDAFEGLHPAEDLDVLRDGSMVLITLRSVNVGPAQLLGWLRELAQPSESLEAELEVGTFGQHGHESDFRLVVRKGETSALRPTLWRDR